MEEIAFTVPLKPASGKGKRASKFRTDSEKYFPIWHRSPENHFRRYSLTVNFHFQGECSGDMDNRLLCIFDALKQRVVYDDSQIKQLVCNIHEYTPRTVIYIKVKEIPRAANPNVY